MAILKETGERKLIDIISTICQTDRRAPVIGIGDDAAIISPFGDVVVSTDVLTKERHMPKGMTYEQFGWSAAASSFSDLVAMGAKPSFFLSQITAPENMDLEDFKYMVSGIDQCCEFANSQVIGGDMKFGPLSIAGTAIGNMEGRKPMTRSGARPGDVVAVTGPLGKPGAGFHQIGKEIEADEEIHSLYVPVPNIQNGLKLSRSGIVTSCIDLSDGLAEAAYEVCKQSHVGITFSWDFLPIPENVEKICDDLALNIEDIVLRWGGEYELMFTFDKADIQKLYDCKLEFSIIGTVDNGNSPVLLRDGKEEVIGHGIF